MERLSLLSKEICHEAGVELDFEELDQLREVIVRIGNKWPDQAMPVLKEKNQPLLDRLFSLENQLDSLILMVPKPAMLRKDFKTKLEDYEKTAEMAIEYANRHITK